MTSEAEAPLMTSAEKADESQPKKPIQISNRKPTKNVDPRCEREGKAEECLYEPPDGGWGWCVVFGTTICTMVMATQGPLFGIFYGDRLRELGATPTLAAWLFNFQSLTWNLAGPWAGLLSEKFTYRPVAMAAAFTAVSSLILSASVTNPYLLLLTFSIVSGIGGGICINCCYQIAAKYFKRRLGLANGIMVSGGSIGLMIMPQLASFLQQLYPFEWASLIAGAVMMHAVAATSLFHPVEWHAKRIYNPQPTENMNSRSLPTQEEEKSQNRKPLDSSKKFKFPAMSNKVYADECFPRCSSVPFNMTDLECQKGRKKRLRTLSDAHYMGDRSEKDSRTGGKGLKVNSELSIFQYGSSTIMGSVLTLPEQPPPSFQENKNGVIRKVEDHPPAQGIWKKFLSHYQPSVLRDPMVISLALVTCITMTAALNMFATMPFVLNDAGYSLQSSASAMSVAATADLVTRIVCDTLTDRPWVKPRVLYGVAQVIFVVTPFALVRCLHHWWVVLVCMSAMGMELGILYVLDVYIIVRLLGVQRLQSVFGMSQLFRVFAFLTLGPLGGVLRDVSGTYASAILFFSSAIFLAHLILLYTVFHTHCQPHTSAQNGSSL